MPALHGADQLCKFQAPLQKEAFLEASSEDRYATGLALHIKTIT